MSHAEIEALVALAVLGAGAALVLWRRRKPAAQSAVVPTVASNAAPTETEKSLVEGLEKTRSGFVARLSSVLGKKQIDDSLVGELEEVLYTADIGGRTAGKLLEAVRSRLSGAELKSAEIVWSVIRDESLAILQTVQAAAPPLDLDRARPMVILTIGVNGVGKTTTIGKLAAKWQSLGKRVLLAAGDTFRAAATEQLEIWGQRAGALVVKGNPGSDPSSVIFEGAKRAVAEKFDILIADTAGRLHTKIDLMDELQKVRRVLQKAIPGAPHEVFLVLDATNGQNAIAQAALFKQALEVSGIVLTKLDGTAKGGVILGIADELRVPVRFIGIGERVADLREFNCDEFVRALYPSACKETA